VIKVCLATNSVVREETMLAIEELMRLTPCEVQIARGRHFADLHNILVCPDDQRTRYAKLTDKYSHYLSVDQDVVFTPAVVLDMLEADKDVISAVHAMPDGRGLTCGRWIDRRPGWLGDNMADSTPPGVYRVDWASDSLMLVKREVWEKLERPLWRQVVLRAIEVGPGDVTTEVVDTTSPEIGLILNFLAHKIEVWAYRAKPGMLHYEWAPTEVTPVGTRLKTEFKPPMGWTGSQFPVV